MVSVSIGCRTVASVKMRFVEGHPYDSNASLLAAIHEFLELNCENIATRAVILRIQPAQ